MFIHPVPKSVSDVRHFRHQFASTQVQKDLIVALTSKDQFDIAAFVSATQTIPSLRSFAGTYLESNFHNVVRKGGEFRIRRLSKTTNGNFTYVFIPVLKVVFFKETDFSDVKHLPDNFFYMQPHSKTFPTLDSFAILPLSLFIKNAEGRCLVSFQSTVSKTHGMNGTLLNRLRNRMKELYGKQFDFYHVFVTGPNGIKTEQTPTQDNGKPFKNYGVPQYAMLLGSSYDDLFDEVYAQE